LCRPGNIWGNNAHYLKNRPPFYPPLHRDSFGRDPQSSSEPKGQSPARRTQYVVWGNGPAVGTLRALQACVCEAENLTCLLPQESSGCVGSSSSRLSALHRSRSSILA